MVSGLFSAKTVVHLSTTPATASFEHAVAVCTETQHERDGTDRKTCLHHFLPHLFGDITNLSLLPLLPAPTAEERDAGGCDQTMRLLRAGRNRPPPPRRRA